MKSEDRTHLPLSAPLRNNESGRPAEETRAWRLGDLMTSDAPQLPDPAGSRAPASVRCETPLPPQDGRALLESLRSIADSFKRKGDFREISTQVVNGVLESLGADYCSIFLLPGSSEKGTSLCIEGVREHRKFLRIHSGPTLLSDGALEIMAVRFAAELGGVLSISDVSQDPRLDHLNLPDFARALVCLPIVAHRVAVGGLLVTHSQAGFFGAGLVTVIRILASMLNHSNHLIASQAVTAPPLSLPGGPVRSSATGVFSIILLEFVLPDMPGHELPLKQEDVALIRSCLAQGLDKKESLTLQATGGLLALLPGVSAAELPQRVRILHDLFSRWRGNQRDYLQQTQIRLGFCACQDGQNLGQTLDVAAIMMHPEGVGRRS